MRHIKLKVQALRLYTGFTALRGIEVLLYSFLSTSLEGGEWSAARAGRNLPPRKTRYPFYKRLGGPQRRYGRVRKIWPSHRNSTPGPSNP